MLNQLLNHKDIKELDKELQVLISLVQSERYYNLYEPEPCSKVPISQVVAQIITLLGSKCSKPIHLHYLWMVLIMTYAVEPTLKCYYPDITLPHKNYPSYIVSNSSDI